MGSSSFATSINCIDGRVQKPISEWIKENYNVDFVDVLSEPGCDLGLSKHSHVEARLKSEAMISINAHKSKLIFVSGHYECAANPVSKEEHYQHIKSAMSRVVSWDLPVKVIGLWVNDSWDIELVE